MAFNRTLLLAVCVGTLWPVAAVASRKPLGDPPPDDTPAQPAPDQPAADQPPAEQPAPEPPPAPAPAPVEQPPPAEQSPDPSPKVNASVAPGDDQHIPVMKLVFFGVYDKEADSIDSDQTHEIEGNIHSVIQNWKGFELIWDGDLDKTVSKVNRGFITQASKPAEKLASMDRSESTIVGDYGFAGKFRVQDGKKLLRLRLITMPDREGPTSGGFADTWSEEQPLDALATLLEHARDQLYAAASDRVQQKSWPFAVIMHDPPTAAVVGKPVHLHANMLCRGDCHLVMNFTQVDKDGTESAEHNKTMTRDDAAGSFHVDLKNLQAGSIRYYFSVASTDGKPMDADITAGTKEEPYGFKMLGTPKSKSKKHDADVAIDNSKSGTSLAGPIGGTVALGLAGAGAIASVVLGVVTNVWHAQPITEVQAQKAQQFVTPVYITLSLSGALAIAGGIVLGLELFAPPAKPPDNKPKDPLAP